MFAGRADQFINVRFLSFLESLMQMALNLKLKKHHGGEIYLQFGVYYLQIGNL